MKTRKLYVILFFGIIIFVMIFAVSAITKKTAKRGYDRFYGWKLLYPFEDEEPENADTASQESSLIEAIEYFKGKISSLTTDELPYYHNFVETARRYEEFINWNMAPALEYNPVIKRDDDYLLGLTKSMDILDSVKSTVELADFCAKKGVTFFYVGIPTKTCKYEDADLSGILDFSNQNGDRFLRGLEENHVKYYDLRKILHNEGMNHHELFFRTDHHWKPEAGLWAAEHILEFLRDDYGWNVKPELLNPENFDSVIYTEWFLGSQGKKLTLAKTKPDNITLFYPKFKTLFNYDVPDLNVNRTGSFDVFYFMEQIEPKDYYNSDPYHAYMHSDYSLARIRNELSDNDKNILIIRDSFGKVLTPFLALGVNNIHEMDLRQFNGSLRTYINSEKIDAVIITYGLWGIGFTVFKPHQELYDFR